MTTTKLLLTVEEAADQLGIGRTLMYSLLRSGEVGSVHIGRLRRVRPTDLASYTAHLSAGTPDAA
jgi:excisionase family DNA binding protein